MQNSGLPPDPIRPLPRYLPQPFEEQHQPSEEEWISGEQLREYWKVVLKYRTLIAVSILLFAAGGLLYAFTVTPLFSAESKIRIGSYDPVLVAADIEEMLQQKSKEQLYLDTQIQEIESLSVADRVLNDSKILAALKTKSGPGLFQQLFGRARTDQDENDPSSSYKHPVRYLKEYLQRVAVKPVRRTSLVVIEATSEEPKLAAHIANKHAAEYIAWVRDVRVRQQSQGLNFLQQQAVELRTRVSDLERELADYAEEHSIVALNKDENIIVQKMSRLNQLLTDLTAKRIEMENQYKEAKAALKNSNTAYDDQSIQTMQAELAQLEAEAGRLSAKFTDSYPQMQQLRSQIAGLREAITAHRKSIVQGLRVKAQAAKQEEKRVREELEAQKSQAFELSKKQVQYNILSREADSTRELLQNVLRQMKETSLSVESSASNVTVVDNAVLPLYPSFPRKKMILLLCAMLGVGVGLGAAFLLHHLDNTLHSPEEVVTAIKLPTLGVVPAYELENLLEEPVQTDEGNEDAGKELVTREAAAGNEPIVFLRAPKALTSEAYRTIRTAILLSQAGQPPRSLLISSAQAGEGKTTLSINLAASLASSGGRVVLLDADLRRPNVWKYFGVHREQKGLVELLAGQADFHEVAIPIDGKGITVVPAGRIPPNPAELLGSAQMRGLLARLSQEYDYVIVDSPPILPVTDAVVLSQFVDGVVLVVKGGSTPKQVVNDAKGRLHDAGARLLGVVLNDVDVTRHDYSYYSRYYYSYYQRDGEPERRRPRLKRVLP